MTHRLPGGTGRSRAVTVTSRPVLDIDPTAVIAARVDAAFDPAMCAREALRGALRARPRIEDGLSALMKGGGPCPEKVPAAAPSPLPPSPPLSPLQIVFPPPPARLPACLHPSPRPRAGPRRHLRHAGSPLHRRLLGRCRFPRSTRSAYRLRVPARRPTTAPRRLVAGDHRVLHGHRGRECGAPLRYRPVGASHSST